MILSTRCAGCSRRGPVLCRTCRFALVARPMIDAPAGVVVASAFTGRVRDVLLGFKYQNRRAVAAHVAGILVQRLSAAGALDEGPDVVTWAPTSASRRRQRGFDQAELIARAVAARLDLPCRRLLEREGASGVQTGRGRRARVDPSTRPRFRAHPRTRGRILVIDDVVTTGATLESAGRTLLGAGAISVVKAAVAATPGSLQPARRVA
ncbi:ComF family protein [Desertimonas flava]|uniref:ComF family protein n=1 Tax=Desertimonas flava TaxID=2064846 RepID=UPI000E34FBA9|nr:phosphoribosyltransferase family protein [Desertimonas flava]